MIISRLTNKNQFRDRKAPYAHFAPVSIVFSVTKTLLVRVIVHSASKEEFHIPEKASARLRLVASELGPGTLKDILITSTARTYEHVAATVLTAKKAGQLMRGEPLFKACVSTQIPSPSLMYNSFIIC